MSIKIAEESGQRRKRGPHKTERKKYKISGQQQKHKDTIAKT
jgi:hypothetical protein